MAKKYQRTKLQEVTIRGYKSIAYDKPVTLKLGDVSILLGANGAGKSNIISFFRMLSYMMSKSFGRYVEIDNHINGHFNPPLHYSTYTFKSRIIHRKSPISSDEINYYFIDS